MLCNKFFFHSYILFCFQTLITQDVVEITQNPSHTFTTYRSPLAVRVGGRKWQRCIHSTAVTISPLPIYPTVHRLAKVQYHWPALSYACDICISDTSENMDISSLTLFSWLVAQYKTVSPSLSAISPLFYTPTPTTTVCLSINLSRAMYLLPTS